MRGREDWFPRNQVVYESALASVAFGSFSTNAADFGIAASRQLSSGRTSGRASRLATVLATVDFAQAVDIVEGNASTRDASSRRGESVIRSGAKDPAELAWGTQWGLCMAVRRSSAGYIDGYTGK